jgi:hypothetical protein
MHEWKFRFGSSSVVRGRKENGVSARKLGLGVRHIDPIIEVECKVQDKIPCGGCRPSNSRPSCPCGGETGETG